MRITPTSSTLAGRPTDGDDRGWQLPFQHAFEVAQRVGDEEAGVMEVLALAHVRRATICTARATGAPLLVGYPADVNTNNALRLLDQALREGDVGQVWR